MRWFWFGLFGGFVVHLSLQFSRVFCNRFPHTSRLHNGHGTCRKNNAFCVVHQTRQFSDNFMCRGSLRWHKGWLWRTCIQSKGCVCLCVSVCVCVCVWVRAVPLLTSTSMTQMSPPSHRPAPRKTGALRQFALQHTRRSVETRAPAPRHPCPPLLAHCALSLGQRQHHACIRPGAARWQRWPASPPPRTAARQAPCHAHTRARAPAADHDRDGGDDGDGADDDDDDGGCRERGDPQRGSQHHRHRHRPPHPQTAGLAYCLPCTRKYPREKKKETDRGRGGEGREIETKTKAREGETHTHTHTQSHTHTQLHAATHTHTYAITRNYTQPQTLKDFGKPKLVLARSIAPLRRRHVLIHLFGAQCEHAVMSGSKVGWGK